MINKRLLAFCNFIAALYKLDTGSRSLLRVWILLWSYILYLIFPICRCLPFVAPKFSPKSPSGLRSHDLSNMCFIAAVFALAVINSCYCLAVCSRCSCCYVTRHLIDLSPSTALLAPPETIWNLILRRANMCLRELSSVMKAGLHISWTVPGIVLLFLFEAGHVVFGLVSISDKEDSGMWLALVFVLSPSRCALVLVLTEVGL